MNPPSPDPHWIDRRRFAKQLAGMAALATLAPAKGLAAPPPAVRPPAPAVYSALEFGAKGDGVALDTVAVQKAVDACAAAGGGMVTLDPGHVFLCGEITLRSHVTLHLRAGSILRTSPERSNFHQTGALLFAKDSEDISVIGTGVIDGNFKAFFPPKGPEGYPVPQPFLGPYDPLTSLTERNPPDGRPRMILLVNCRRVRLEGFTIQHSPTWTIHPIGCEHLHISNLSILNDLDVPNCDGIDIDHCRHVLVEGCTIIAGDDCIILKASRNFGEYGPCESVVVTNCTLESSSAAIKVEPEGPFPVRSVTVSNCTIARSNRGISILNRDGALVEDLLFSGLVITTEMRSAMWWGSGEPVAVTSMPRAAGGPPGLIRNVSFSNLVCRGESGLLVRGAIGAPVEGIRFNNVTVVVEKTTPIPGGFYDMRPGAGFGASGLDHRAIAGVLASDVDGLVLSDITVRWAGQKPAYYASALELHRCRETTLTSFFGNAAHGAQPAVFDEVSFAQPIAPAP